MAAPLVGNPKLIAFGSEYNEPSIRTGSFLPPAVADRTCGNLCVVNQTRLAGNPKIAFIKSTDGANTWIAPIAISDNPAVNVSPDGRVLTAVFYHHRDNASSDTLVDLYLAQSFDAGATWKTEHPVAFVSTNARSARCIAEQQPAPLHSALRYANFDFRPERIIRRMCNLSIPAKLAQRQPISRLRLGFGAVEREIRVLLQETFVVGEKFHGVVGFQAVGLDGIVDLRLQQAH
jgi:hypothetical protein